MAAHRMDLLVTTCLAMTCCPASFGHFVTDQSMTLQDSSLIFSRFFDPLGQEFVPDLPALDFVELYTSDLAATGGGANVPGLGAELRVTVREDSIAGPIVGTSEITSLPDLFEGVTLFTFSSTLAVVPGDRYVIEVIHESGDDWYAHIHQNQPITDLYPEGRLVSSGTPSDSYLDLWFREGVVIPEPSSFALAAIGFALAMRSRSRA